MSNTLLSNKRFVRPRIFSGRIFFTFLFSLLILSSKIFAGNGGPDTYGYTWKDSNDPNGPTYNWIDVTAFPNATQVKLLGDAFSMQGKGDIKLDLSDMNMEFNVGWARMAQALPFLSNVETAVSGKLFKIRLKGPLANVTYTKVPIPVILDPVKKFLSPTEKGK